MKRLTIVALSVAAAVTIVALGEARESREKTPPRPRLDNNLPVGADVRSDRAPSASSAIYDTTELGYWTFDQAGCDPQGWTSVDMMAQTGLYWHVDDFIGLGGGDFGRLLALEGNQSLWCGVRPDVGNPYVCGYATPPGYGDNWDQTFTTTACLNVSGDVVMDFLVAWDSEPGYDYTYVEYDKCDDYWRRLFTYNDIGNGFATHVIADSLQLHDGNVRLRLHFTSDGAWSDQDGLWDTDGAVIIDSLTVSDSTGILLPTELFETESLGDTATASGNWVAGAQLGYGDFAGLFDGTQVVQEDPCVSNISCLWGFFNGSTYHYGCRGWPEQLAVPYVNEREQYIFNQVWSPVIPWTGSGTVAELEFSVYRDLYWQDMVFYEWFVRSITNGCPGIWRNHIYIYYGNQKDWFKARFSMGELIEPGATHIQIALGVRDFCGIWPCWHEECHSHSPLFDDVRVYRVAVNGPHFSVSAVDLFQDTFASDGTITGTARADIADDILPRSSAGILPGDSAVVTVADPEVGLAIDPYTGIGPAVYAYVSVRPPQQPNKSGAPLTDDTGRWPVVRTFVHNGVTWTHIRMDTVYATNGDPVPDRYCVDLNDDLFTPGDTVYFAFGAQSAAPSNVKSYWSEFTGVTTELSDVLDQPMEFTVLPAGGWRRGGDILYVDGMDGRGAQPFFDTAFEMLGIAERVDRYDIRGPSSKEGNHPSSRIFDPNQQLAGVYRKILWDCGNLHTAFSNGDGNYTGKSNDTELLLSFLDGLTDPGGVYLCGDDAAHRWDHYFWDPSAVLLRSKYIDFHVNDSDHQSAVGVSPLVIGEAGSIFESASGLDTMTVYGGCPTINDFDIISPRGKATLAASYHGGGVTKGAVVTDATTNPHGAVVKFVLSGFSYSYIRDAGPEPMPATVTHLHRILMWLGDFTAVSAGGGTNVYVNSLAQNYPNPFNPTTTVRYSIAQQGRVTLRVYNVAGQLVKTLVDEEQSPASTRTVAWDGRNQAGHAVSSGVYFYKLTAKGFNETKKMILLK